MQIKNLTPHPVDLYTEDGIITIPSSGAARVQLEREVEDYALVGAGAARVPIRRVRPVRVEGLPPPDGQSIYIVSAIVERYVDRDDVVTVDKLIRSEGGNVVGAAALSRSA